MSKYLVTGATGFIGNYIVEQLLEKGHTVIATSSTPDKAKQFSWYTRVIYKELNLSKIEETCDYYEFFYKPDFLIHLAWGGLPNFKSLIHIEENLWQQYFFLKNLIVHGLKDITITGTCFEYGLKEGQLNENDDISPVTAYGTAKNSLRLFLKQLQKHFPFDLKWVRLFYLYGEGQHPKSILPQLQTALDRGDLEFKMSGGEQTRDYLPVEKVAEHIISIASQSKITGIINCCSNDPVTINQLVKNYLLNTGKSINLIKGAYPYPDYEPMHFWGDNEKLKKVSEK